MPRIAVLRGFGKRKSGKKAKSAAKRARHSDKAHTPQALRFKRAVEQCGKQQHSGNLKSAQKALGACMRKILSK